VKHFSEIQKNALKDVAEFMSIAARTAPKAKGTDNLEIIIIDDDKTKNSLIAKMKEISTKNQRPGLARDAENIKEAPFIVIIATKLSTLGLNCGFCGFSTCEELKKAKAVCAYNPMDLGIAIGSAVSICSKFHVDNRIMYSIGKASIELGLFKENPKIALGIPISATGKNPFFDRK